MILFNLNFIQTNFQDTLAQLIKIQLIRRLYLFLLFISTYLNNTLPNFHKIWPPQASLTNAQQSSPIVQTFIDTLKDQLPTTSKIWPPQASLSNVQQRLLMAQTINDTLNSQFPQISPRNFQQSSCTFQSPSNDARIFHPTKAELVGIIKKLKNHKACGQDLLYSECLKTDSRLCAGILLPIISRVWFERVCPNDWITATLINFPKTKDSKFLEDWRGISLNSVVYKIFANIILNRLRPLLEPLFTDSLVSFRKGRNTLEAILSVKI
ncbi:uncharacterized protein LOC135924751 [Gordionus sp. m RMFG-2023]|uniref:uncharacterized protein LOC135924751 n=1 Tax=Gordionus sp. m RMFG-2023 TaxID=3053472 RepID=UPI0031FCDAE4